MIGNGPARRKGQARRDISRAGPVDPPFPILSTGPRRIVLAPLSGAAAGDWRTGGELGRPTTRRGSGVVADHGGADCYERRSYDAAPIVDDER